MPEPLDTDMQADDVIRLLDLTPHPEGGFYRETFRDPENCDGRSRSTAIYFLLRKGEISRWHRVNAAEIWHWHAGAPLELKMNERGHTAVVVLGCDLMSGEQPQGIVPAGAWQQACSLGKWTLVGCTVAPGFEFSGFEMAPEGWEPAANNTG